PAAPPGPRSADPDRVDPSTLPPPTIGTAIGPPGPGNRPSPGNQPATSGWYNGPLPIAGLAPRETIGSAIATTAIKALTAVVVFGGVLLLIPFLFIALIAAFAGSAGGDLDDAGRTRTLIAGESNADITLVAVPVEGVILGEDRGGGGLFAPTDLTYGYTIQEDLAELAEDDSVDGIILEVNSPGGTIFGSKAIADGVAAYQDATGKPVVAYVSGISASGGVYAMAGADRIYADHGTLIGSIGVIFGPFVTYNDVRAIDGGILGGGVTTEGGIEFEFLTAGRSKDFGNPYRPFTDEERAVLQVGLDDAYDEFVAHVAKGRGLTEGEIVDGLGALIFGEQQAVSNGLIDGISNRNDSYEQAAVAAGMTDEQTFKVERLDSGGDDFFSLLGGRLTGTDEPSDGATGAGANPLLTSPLCLGSGAIMAYHGDPTLLCLPGQ
ncbi:MAG: S49 family peptidase, partial [Actinomycetota bacterium]